MLTEHMILPNIVKKINELEPNFERIIKEWAI